MTGYYPVTDACLGVTLLSGNDPKSSRPKHTRTFLSYGTVIPHGAGNPPHRHRHSALCRASETSVPHPRTCTSMWHDGCARSRTRVLGGGKVPPAIAATSVQLSSSQSTPHSAATAATAVASQSAALACKQLPQETSEKRPPRNFRERVPRKQLPRPPAHCTSAQRTHCDLRQLASLGQAE